MVLDVSPSYFCDANSSTNNPDREVGARERVWHKLWAKSGIHSGVVREIQLAELLGWKMSEHLILFNMKGFWLTKDLAAQRVWELQEVGSGRLWWWSRRRPFLGSGGTSLRCCWWKHVEAPEIKQTSMVSNYSKLKKKTLDTYCNFRTEPTT